MKGRTRQSLSNIMTKMILFFNFPTNIHIFLGKTSPQTKLNFIFRLLSLCFIILPNSLSMICLISLNTLPRVKIKTIPHNILMLFTLILLIFQYPMQIILIILFLHHIYIQFGYLIEYDRRFDLFLYEIPDILLAKPRMHQYLFNPIQWTFITTWIYLVVALDLCSANLSTNSGIRPLMESRSERSVPPATPPRIFH